VLEQIRSTLTLFAGANFSVNTFLTERIEETVSGFTAPVVVNLFGNDLHLLDRKAQEVAAVLAAMPQTESVQVQAPQGNPQLNIRLRGDLLTRWGIAPLDALEAVQIAYEGTVVAQIYEGNRVFDVSVILDPALRRHPSQVAALPLINPEGKVIRLGEVAEISQSIGRFLILHDGAQRLQSITAQPKGDIAAFVAEAKQRVSAQVSLPRGVYALFAGDAESRAQAQRELLLHAVLAGAGVILLLFVALGSTRSLLLVFANLPFALVGGVIVIAALGEPLSVGTLVGFVTLFGITLRNSMMLLSHYDHLVQKEGLTWGRETAILGAQQRLAPILMTALVAGLGLLPLAVTSGAPGNEIEGPMALVILGGLVTSTILNLLVLPTLALRFGRFAPRPEIF
jgi:Cu/Ag efflux pump CusA